MEEEIIYSKNDFKISKKNERKYNILLILENKKMRLDEILDFPFIKLICDLNGDIFERIEMKVNEQNDQAMISILVKELFNDLGLPQYYSYNLIEKVKIERYSRVFNMRSILYDRPRGMPEMAERIPVKRCVFESNWINSNKIECNIEVELIENIKKNVSLQFLEKMMGGIMYKILNRVRNFINKISMEENMKNK